MFAMGSWPNLSNRGVYLSKIIVSSKKTCFEKKLVFWLIFLEISFNTDVVLYAAINIVLLLCSIPYPATNYEWFFDRTIWLIDRIPKRTTTPDQSGPGSNGNEGILSRSPEVEPHHPIQCSVIPKISLSGRLSYLFAGDTVCVL